MLIFPHAVVIKIRSNQRRLKHSTIFHTQENGLVCCIMYHSPIIAFLINVKTFL